LNFGDVIFVLLQKGFNAQFLALEVSPLFLAIASPATNLELTLSPVLLKMEELLALTLMVTLNTLVVPPNKTQPAQPLVLTPGPPGQFATAIMEIRLVTTSSPNTQPTEELLVQARTTSLNPKTVLLTPPPAQSNHQNVPPLLTALMEILVPLTNASWKFPLDFTDATGTHPQTVTMTLSVPSILAIEPLGVRTL